ncbi:hypothetical protein GmHk_13G036459 [Glycine max]|nr:hypothetical protein GmHk_13G036459 [Glycine max]
MATPPTSPPHLENPPKVTSKRTRRSTRLRRLTTRSLNNPTPVVNINPATGQQISDPTVKYSLHPATWAKFAKSRQTPNWQGIRKKVQEIQKFNDFPHVLSRGGYELLENKLMDEKRKRRDQQDEFTENPTLNLDPLSPVSRHLKWKMVRTKCFGQMTSKAAQQIADKIDSLEEQATTGVTISQYFGQASCASTTSSPPISQQQLAEIIDGIKDEIRKEVEEEHKQQQEAWRRAIEEQHSRNLEIMKQELKQALKIELSHIASHQSAPIEPPKMQALVARVTTKGSCAAPEAQGLPKEPYDVDVDLMGLFKVEDEITLLVALGKMYNNSSTIHNVRYVDDVVRVNVVTYYHPDAEVPFPASEPPLKSVEQPDRANVVATIDPLGELVKKLYVVYQKSMELSWDKAKFGIPNSTNGFFITHVDSHVQAGAYECGYYVMHWMWCIVTSGLKNEWNKCFSNGTPLDSDTMTTLRKKWPAYFLQVGKMDVN